MRPTPRAHGPVPFEYRRIRDDARSGRGPGRYMFRDVRRIFLHDDSGLTSVYVDDCPVGYVTSEASRRGILATREWLRQGHRPRTLVLRGHYGERTFFVDRVTPAGFWDWLSSVFLRRAA